jgi:hypothetical protein
MALVRVGSAIIEGRLGEEEAFVIEEAGLLW